MPTLGNTQRPALGGNIGFIGSNAEFRGLLQQLEEAGYADLARLRVAAPQPLTCGGALAAASHLATQHGCRKLVFAAPLAEQARQQLLIRHGFLSLDRVEAQTAAGQAKGILSFKLDEQVFDSAGRVLDQQDLAKAGRGFYRGVEIRTSFKDFDDFDRALDHLYGQFECLSEKTPPVFEYLKKCSDPQEMKWLMVSLRDVYFGFVAAQAKALRNTHTKTSFQEALQILVNELGVASIHGEIEGSPFSINTNHYIWLLKAAAAFGISLENAAVQQAIFGTGATEYFVATAFDGGVASENPSRSFACRSVEERAAKLLAVFLSDVVTAYNNNPAVRPSDRIENPIFFDQHVLLETQHVQSVKREGESIRAAWDKGIYDPARIMMATVDHLFAIERLYLTLLLMFVTEKKPVPDGQGGLVANL